MSAGLSQHVMCVSEVFGQLRQFCRHRGAVDIFLVWPDDAMKTQFRAQHKYTDLLAEKVTFS